MILDEKKSKGLNREIIRMLIEPLELLRNVGSYWKTNTFYGRGKLQDVTYACLILHNMIIEDVGRMICAYDEYEIIPETWPVMIGVDKYIDQRADIRSTETHRNFRMSLMEHIYEAQNIDLNMGPQMIRKTSSSMKTTYSMF